GGPDVLPAAGCLRNRRRSTSTKNRWLGIGLTVLVDILVGGALTGAAMNPARAFGPALAGGFWQNQLVYWIGPIIGAVIAALLYEYVILRMWRAGHKVV